MRMRKRARAVRGVCALAASARDATCRKAAFHRHFSIASNFSRAIAPPRNFFAARFADERRAKAAGKGARHLHTKLSGVTVIFFLL
jgi:hypothetical protein